MAVIMNDSYNKALSEIVGGLGNFAEPAARMLIESYYSNPVLHPIAKMRADRTEDKFRDTVASLNLLEEELKKPGAGVYPNGVTRVENPTFEDKYKAAQLEKYDLASEKNPLAYKYGDEEAALNMEKKKVKYVRPKYY